MPYLKSITLTDFRSYASQEVEFSPGVTFVFGQNGQGKTNLLESACVLLTMRSFRCRKLQRLIRWGQDSFHIRAVIDGAGSDVRLGFGFGERRDLKINGQPVARASDFIGSMHCVPFVPEDIDIIKGPRSARRRFMDMSLAQMSVPYLHLLQDYQKALKSRNLLLKSGAPDPKALTAYNGVLIRAGARIMSRRQQYLQDLEGHLGECTQGLFPAGQTMTMRYAPTCARAELASGAEINSVEGAFADALERARDNDIHAGFTGVGPHRDEVDMALDAHGLTEFGSEGQRRLAALGLRAAEARLLTAESGGDRVIFLVDDVTGELDARAASAFNELIGSGHQVLVAGTSQDGMESLAPSRVIEVKNGSLFTLK